jgi:hypothetical protein
MASAVRKLGHEDQVGVVEHLDELRTRLIVSLVVVAAAFAVCLWQNHALLHLVNKPLATQTQKQVRAGHGPLGATYTDQQNIRAHAVQLAQVLSTLERPGSGASAPGRPPSAETSAAPSTTGRSRSSSLPARRSRSPTDHHPKHP